MIVPTTFGTRLQALEFRREMMQMQVDTGQLEMGAYLQQLREAIAQEKARSKQLKALPGGARGALDAFKRAKIMHDECNEAAAGGA